MRSAILGGGPTAYAYVRRHPVASASLGAVAIAMSGIFYRWSETTPETAAFFRCLYAVPFLALLAHFERRRQAAAVPTRRRLLSYGAGVLFAADLIFWHRSIEAVGAGLGTVLANLQVLFVVVLAWGFSNERPTYRQLAALPLALCGALLISGVLDRGAYGRDPAVGVVYGFLTGAAYAGFLLLLRRRGQIQAGPAGALLEATLSAAVVLGVYGLLTSTVDPIPAWPQHGWLAALAIESQVFGWLLITIALPLLPAALTSITLLLQPVAAVFLAMTLLREYPSVLQLTGAGLLLLGVVVVHLRRTPRLRRVLQTEMPRH